MERRETDPYPWTWELPAAAVAVAVIVAALALQCGRSAAFAIAGRGWVWPAPDHLLTSILPLLAGHTDAGLGATAQPLSRALVAVMVIIAELSALAVLAIIGWQLFVRFGPGPIKGVASAAQADRLLGRSRLRRAQSTLRPDLCSHPIDFREGGAE